MIFLSLLFNCKGLHFFSHLFRCLKVILSWPLQNANVPDDLGQTPVHIAARFGRASCLRLLLYKGGKLDIKDKEGKTPIQLACDHDDCTNVILLYQFSTMLSKCRVEVKGIILCVLIIMDKNYIGNL